MLIMDNGGFGNACVNKYHRPTEDLAVGIGMQWCLDVPNSFQAKKIMIHNKDHWAKTLDVPTEIYIRMIGSRVAMI